LTFSSLHDGVEPPMAILARAIADAATADRRKRAPHRQVQQRHVGQVVRQGPQFPISSSEPSPAPSSSRACLVKWSTKV